MVEQKSAHDIAIEIGAPTDGLLGTQEWQSAIYTDRIVSELNYGSTRECVCFRVVNSKTGEVFSKLQGEGSGGDVDAIYDEMNATHRKVSFEFFPAIYAAIPDMHPEAEIVRGLTIGGKSLVADIVAGKLENIREAPGSVAVFVDGNGEIQFDTSSLSDADKALADGAITKAKSAALDIKG